MVLELPPAVGAEILQRYKDILRVGLLTWGDENVSWDTTVPESQQLALSINFILADLLMVLQQKVGVMCSIETTGSVAMDQLASYSAEVVPSFEGPSLKVRISWGAKDNLVHRTPGSGKRQVKGTVSRLETRFAVPPAADFLPTYTCEMALKSNKSERFQIRSSSPLQMGDEALDKVMRCFAAGAAEEAALARKDVSSHTPGATAATGVRVRSSAPRKPSDKAMAAPESIDSTSRSSSPSSTLKGIAVSKGAQAAAARRQQSSDAGPRTKRKPASKAAATLQPKAAAPMSAEIVGTGAVIPEAVVDGGAVDATPATLGQEVLVPKSGAAVVGPGPRPKRKPAAKAAAKLLPQAAAPVSAEIVGTEAVIPEAVVDDGAVDETRATLGQEVLVLKSGEVVAGPGALKTNDGAVGAVVTQGTSNELRCDGQLKLEVAAPLLWAPGEIEVWEAQNPLPGGGGGKPTSSTSMVTLEALSTALLDMLSADARLTRWFRLTEMVTLRSRLHELLHSAMGASSSAVQFPPAVTERDKVPRSDGLASCSLVAPAASLLATALGDAIVSTLRRSVPLGEDPLLEAFAACLDGRPLEASIDAACSAVAAMLA